MSQPSITELPEGWSVEILGNLLVRPPSYGINAPAVPHTFDAPTYIRITDISDDGRFTPRPKVSVDHPASASYLLAPGDLVFARTGASVGKSYRYRDEDGALVFAGFLIRVTPDPEALLPEFLAQLVQGETYWNWVGLTSTRSGQPGINGREYAQLPIALPPMPEQRVITDALLDADELIASLERLIAKKGDIKQGVMQQLLTGETRLPGFTEPWRTPCSLLDMCEKRAGYWGSDVATQSALTQARVIRAGDITRDGRLASTAQRFFTSAEWKYSACHVDDFVITASGNGLGKTFYVRNGSRLAASNFVRLLRPKAQVSGEFLAYVMRSRAASIKLKTHTATSAYPNLLPSFFTDPWLIVPSYDEQLAIASVLRSMDDDLDAHERRLAKAKAIKQGMMQELLNGRTRLPILEAVA